MKKIFNFSFSKIYMISVILISLLILGGYFSYAMFTVSKEKSNAISIVTGNLTYKLLVNDKETNTLTVSANSRQDFIITLNNPNNRIARFNFYYLGDLLDGVDIGYIEKDEFNVPPTETGMNLEKVDTTGSSNTYIVRVANTTENEISIELGVEVGLDYNDLELPKDGHLLRKITSTGIIKEVLEDDIMNRLNYEDSEQTFVTGEANYNYIWYSGKLWRVLSIDSSDNSIKIITEWPISINTFNNADSNTFKNSNIETWLNDTTVDGFLGNLRDYENFIKLDSKWNATTTTSTNKPAKTTMVEDPVGLINIYEYTMSYKGTTYGNGYLNDGLYWWSLTSGGLNDSGYNAVYTIRSNGTLSNDTVDWSAGVRPVLNLKNNIQIENGTGTADDPYRLKGDNDINLSGTLLNTRYSGEYINFGIAPNNLYRIVSHETEGLTKITSAEPLKEDKVFKTIIFGNSVTFSKTNTIGTFLNGEYLINYIGDNYLNMIEENTTWYLGTVGNGSSYRLAKYNDVNMTSTTTSTISQVGLLRYGELMGGQSNRYLRKENGETTNLTTSYWLLSPFNSSEVHNVGTSNNDGYFKTSDLSGIKPALNLKQNVIITGGDGTKENPFTLALE